MGKTKLELGCCLCSEKHETVVDVPDDWATQHDCFDVESGFCPNHAEVAKFVDAQCPGCVGGWQDCELWRDFAYGKKALSEGDFAIMRKGICPRRTNGTFGFSRSSGIEELNLSKNADCASGMALEQAIRDYWKRYSRAYDTPNRNQTA